jgi:putative FmdB family regulatory protein
MPTYDYACAACGHRFEVVHGVHGHGPEACPSCGGGPVRKAFAPPTVVFKGSGWAKLDRRASAKRESTDESKPSGGETAAPAAPTGDGGSTATKQTD